MLALALAQGTQAQTPLSNGALQSGSLASAGDAQSWTFPADGGDALVLRVGATNFTPRIRLFAPDNTLVAETTSGNTITRDGFVTARATNSGNYTVIVSASYANQSGGYGLSLAQAPKPFVVSPGDEGGVLTNGTFNAGTIALGDLDLWSFTANSGDGLVVRVGATNFTPWIQLYGPGGALVEETKSGNSITRDGFLTLQATNSGNFTVVVSATYAGQSGSYGLSMAQAPRPFVVSPGDEGGVLTNGTLNGGTIALGDLDLWRFVAAGGDGLMLRVGATNFTPWVQLYGPAGELVGETKSGNSIARDGFLTLQATNSGDYTVVVGAAYAGQSGSYGLSLAQAPGVPVIVEGDEGGSLVNGLTYPGTLDLGDLDVWTFLGTPGDSNVLRVAATGFTPWIRLYGPEGALVGETKSGNTIARNGSVTLSVTNLGAYTVVVSATFAGQSGSYTFKQSRVPPDLMVPDTPVIDESTSLNVSISAQDPDEPVKPLVFTLLSGPPGLSLATAGATNATLSWTTTEADGPSTNPVVVTVTDTVNGRAFIRTNQFAVVVREVNSPPQLTTPAVQTVDELTPLLVTASATDPDLPANSLTYSLLAPPAGMTIDPASGLINWTPTEAQGPSTNQITVQVTDNGAPGLSASQTFAVVVKEVNAAPVLEPIADQVFTYGSVFTVQAVATDSDLPVNTLTFSLDQAPTDATINANGGLISWTPTESQLGVHPFTVRVTDSGSPALSATTSFQVTVLGADLRLGIERVAVLMQINVTGDVNSHYVLQQSADLVRWEKLIEFSPLPTSPFSYIDPESRTNTLRFYRLELVPPR